MAHTLKEKDGSTRNTGQSSDAHNPLTLTLGSAASGLRVYVKESTAVNGDITWRFHHDEPPAK